MIPSHNYVLMPPEDLHEREGLLGPAADYTVM